MYIIKVWHKSKHLWSHGHEIETRENWSEMIESQARAKQRQRVEWLQHHRAFWGDRNVLHIDWGQVALHVPWAFILGLLLVNNLSGQDFQFNNTHSVLICLAVTCTFRFWLFGYVVLLHYLDPLTYPFVQMTLFLLTPNSVILIFIHVFMKPQNPRPLNRILQHYPTFLTLLIANCLLSPVDATSQYFLYNQHVFWCNWTVNTRWSLFSIAGLGRGNYDMLILGYSDS